MAKPLLLLLALALQALLVGALQDRDNARQLHGALGAASSDTPCAWQRIWRGETFQATDDAPYSNKQVTTIGTGFTLEAKRTNGSSVSGRVVFPLDGVFLPDDGKLVVRAQLPKGLGVVPLVKLVKQKDGDVVQELLVLHGRGEHPQSLGLHLTTLQIRGDTDAVQSSSTLRMKDFPCIDDFSADVHAFQLTWTRDWLRWYVDDVFYLEAPRRAFFETPSPGTYDYSLVVELGVDPSNTTNISTVVGPPKFIIQDILLFRQPTESAAAIAACTPSFVNPMQCVRYRPAPPLVRTICIHCVARPIVDHIVAAVRRGPLRSALTLAQVFDFIESLPAQLERFPLVFRNETIGRSIDGHPIVALCLGLCHATTPSSPPQALYTGLHHAREPMSMMNLVFFVDHLVLGLVHEDAAITQLLFSRQLWFVLVVNPDGYAYNQATLADDAAPDKTFSGQRKNRNPVMCHSEADMGVDLNRNYDVCFTQDEAGSSPNACAEDFRGTAPFSEPETQAIRLLVEQRNFSTALNYHSYGKYFNIPFACQAKGAPSDADMSVFNRLAADMTKWNHFKYGQSWKESNLYTVNGETSDWMWNTHGIFAMSPETGPSFEFDTLRGFWPDDDDMVQGICEELLHSNKVAAIYAGPVYGLSMAGWESNATFITLDLSVINTGLRGPTTSLEAVAGLHMNGSGSGPVESVPVSAATNPANDGTNFSLVVPKTSSAQHAVFVVLRDALSCLVYRISLGRGADAFQVWRPLPLPRCGTCAAFGISDATTVHDCTGVASLVHVANQPIRDVPVGVVDGNLSHLVDAPNGDAVPMTVTTKKNEPKNIGVAEKHKAPVNEKKALLLVSLVVLLGMVVALIGLRHAKAKQSAKEDYAMVAKTEQEGHEQDNMLGMESPKSLAPLRRQDEHGVVIGGCRVRSPVRGQGDEEGLLYDEGPSQRVRSPPPPPLLSSSAGTLDGDEEV
ncbi:Aste57867_18621 [Aphanomyces stellatus]|uniref:Aste57867_18621 protein n=1 Tax=Aphanomyces stellatus TaxID=120398 RepID=A0A485LBG6_9STRA|nr:hypothetical protein As57867_018559 [Aphanomyces stellatus]VFT95356.1 Aste57867_18621 [Aphanomyces stellatus]